jgi:hypothetical protein
VSDLDDVAVAMELQKLVVRHLADGHSVVYPLPTDRVPMPGMLPIQLYFFSDGLFVVDAEEPHTDLVDQRVLAIGGRSTDGLLDDLKPIVSRDNEQGLRWIGSLYLRSPAALRAIGYANSLETVPFTFSDGQKQHTIALSPEPPQRRNEKLPPPPGLDQPPRWQARADENYWHEAVPEMGAVYVQFNQVRNASSGASIAEFAKKVRDTLRASGAKELILDVRHNNGGNNFLHWPILRVVAWHGLNGDDHRTFVLIGRNTFSACQNFVNFLERATDPIFVGEISSSKPNFAGEGNRVELPWSGLMLSISSRWWQDSYPSDERPYIPVDMPVEISSRDWLAGRDPVMEALRNFLCLRSHKTEGGGCDGRGAPL